MSTFADQVIKFHQNLSLEADLPQEIQVLNPYQNNPVVPEIMEKFYGKYFDDNQKRKLIVGINPGRFGAGMTGIPFTDTKRLYEYCGIKIEEFETHEPSSVFVYEVIEAFGGVEEFYRDFYINSVCPLGLIRKNKKDNWVNCNYYDSADLFKMIKPFIISTLKQQISFGIDTSVVFSFGKKNADFLRKINEEEKLFEKIVVLSHPRYIIQYQFKNKKNYVDKYVKSLIKNL